MPEGQVEIQYWNQWEYKILNRWINFCQCPEIETKKDKELKVNHMTRSQGRLAAGSAKWYVT